MTCIMSIQTDAAWQDILLCVQTSSLLSDPKRMRMSDPSYYLRSAAEMEALLPGCPRSDLATAC